MATTRPPPLKPLDLDLTIVSAKHLKNVNWRNGDLSPYAIFWLDPAHRLSTKSDDSGSTRPVWNERFLIPVSLPPNDAVLTIELFHSKPSDTPKPLIGTLKFPIKGLIVSDESNKLRKFDLRRPSGRLQGQIRLKVSLRDRPVPDYQITTQPNYYYSTAPPPPPPRYSSSPAPSPYTSSLPPSPPPPQPPQSSYPYGSYNSDPYSGYYSNPSGYYSQPAPPPPPRPFFDRTASYGGGPSAPVDYSQYDQKQKGDYGPYDQKVKSGKMGMGMGTGLAVGAVAGALGGLAIEEGLKYEEDKIADRVESDHLGGRDDYSDYRGGY